MTAGAHGAAPIGPAEGRALLAPWLEPGGVAVLAISGGPDSVVLMRLAARLPGVRASVATVDHGLRPGSRAEAEEVAGWAASLGLPHEILTWTGPKPATRVQERARAARYRLLAAFAARVGAGRIVTAHTLDDQAETILMRLVAGSGTGGLAGMDAVSGKEGVTLVRPFLTVPKARLLATCAAEGWPYLLDPSNADPRFGRVRLRGLMPGLAAEGLSASRLATLGRRARRADDALAAASAQAWTRVACVDGSRVELDVARLRREPEEIALRVLALGIATVGAAAERPRLERLEAAAARLRGALEGGGRLRLNLAGVLIEVSGGRVVLTPEPPRRGGKARRCGLRPGELQP